MTAPLADIWVYLQATPLLFLTLTLLVYQAAYWIYRRANFHPLLNPVAWSIVVLVLLLRWTGTPYETYFGGAQFVHFLLGPATVALAVPLYAQWDKLKRALLPIGAALLAGAVTALVSAVGIAWALGASPATLLSLVPKSVTAPIAMGIADKMGGLPALAAVFAVTTGILGAALGKYVLDACRVRDWRARGFALGLAAHGIGTARAFQVNADAGAYAGLAFALHGLVAAILFPLGWWWLRSAA